jgi:hypothetical protein
MPAAAAVSQLHLTSPFYVTNNLWYFIGDGAAMGVVKIENGVVQEVGLVNKLVSATHKALKFLLGSWGSLPWGHQPP